MRYYPERVPNFYAEDLNEWNKHQTCHDLYTTIARQKRSKIFPNDYPIVYYPEVEQKAIPVKKKKGKKKEQLVRDKPFDEDPQKVILYWNDLRGKKIDPIKQEHLNWQNWPTTRLKKAYLPFHIRPTYIKILQGQPPPLPYANLPINLADVREIIKQDKIAEKLAKKLAKEQKEAEKLAAQIAAQKGGK